MNFLTGLYNGLSLYRAMIDFEFIGFMIGLLAPALLVFNLVVYFVWRQGN